MIPANREGFEAASNSNFEVVRLLSKGSSGLKRCSDTVAQLSARFWIVSREPGESLNTGVG